jgi:hypothetical protein
MHLKDTVPNYHIVLRVIITRFPRETNYNTSASVDLMYAHEFACFIPAYQILKIAVRDLHKPSGARAYDLISRIDVRLHLVGDRVGHQT